IRFVQYTLADDCVHFVAAALLIVDGIVLDVPDHVLRLFALDAISNEGARKNRVLAHVLKGAAIARLAGDIRAATECHVVALRAQLAADERAVFARCLWVPTGSRPKVRSQRRRVAAIGSAIAHAVSSV